jgi:mannose-1-phosphate guanylyltransferase
MIDKSHILIPIVLAGGTGSRLWPLSRTNYPKQLQALCHDQTLLQTTISRIKSIPQFSPPIVITNEAYQFLVMDQINQVTDRALILLEAIARSTGPAIALATIYTMIKMASDPLLLILPTDSYIPDIEQFETMILGAINAAILGKLVTFGVPPLFPETGYGYIEIGKPLLNDKGYEIKRFIEKPNVATAKRYVASEKHYWNTGIFLFRASVLVQELKKYAPKILEKAQNAMQHVSLKQRIICYDDTKMKNCPTISIDKCIFEQTKQAAMFAFRGEWQDVGSWNTLYSLGQKDPNGNVASGRVVSLDTENCYLYSKQQLLVTSGIKNCLVVVTSDAILIAQRDEKLSIKAIVEYLIKHKHDSEMLSTVTYCAWGHYEIIQSHNAFDTIKYIFVKPNAVFSLKKSPSVHWIIMKGMAHISLGAKQLILSENDCLFIAKGQTIQLKNQEEEPIFNIFREFLQALLQL